MGVNALAARVGVRELLESGAHGRELKGWAWESKSGRKRLRLWSVVIGNLRAKCKPMNWVVQVARGEG